MTTEGLAGRDDALPNDSEMRFYARAYAAQASADELFLRWETYQAHAMLLEQSPDRVYKDYGLNGRQLAEGARIAARRMALLLGEAPTAIREVLALKVHAFESLVQLEGELQRSHTIRMLETAMKADGQAMGIVLLPFDQPPGQRQ
jgi:hypothetical protein